MPVPNNRDIPELSEPLLLRKVEWSFSGRSCWSDRRDWETLCTTRAWKRAAIREYFQILEDLVLTTPNPTLGGNKLGCSGKNVRSDSGAETP
jgi:hypothetical protein